MYLSYSVTISDTLLTITTKDCYNMNLFYYINYWPLLQRVIITRHTDKLVNENVMYRG